MVAWLKYWVERRFSTRGFHGKGSLFFLYAHKQLLGVISHTPVEVDHLGKVQAAHGWVDAVRHFIPEDQNIFSWWSYRNRDWRVSNRGRRLDHVWVTPALTEHLAGTEILEATRDWERPSDHCPVAVSLNI